jgi:TonB family protein
MICKTNNSILLHLIIGLFVPLILFGQSITPPECLSGKRLLKEFFKEEMAYPEKARKENREGIVEVSFMVHKDGSTSNYKISKSVSDEVDAEALRLCKKILWNPATDLGRPIDYNHKFEIKFNIKKYEKLVKLRGYDEIIYPHLPIDSSFKVFQLVELDQAPKPIFTDEQTTFNNFIAGHLKYPETAFKQNVSGKVKLEFVVEPSGRISNIAVRQALGGGCTEEAIRVVKLINWYPGIAKEAAVRTWMCMEITFDIAKQSVGGSIPTPGQIY